MKPITHPLAIAHMEARAKFLSAHTQEADEAESATRDAWSDAGYPLYADPPPNTVKVRVAVSVDADGAWYAHGGSGYSEAESIDECAHRDGDRLTWLTAYVPLPEPAAEIVAEVESA